MKFNKAIVALLLALVMVVGLSAAAMADGAIKIGVIGPFTGAAAIYGNACKFGAQVAGDRSSCIDIQRTAVKNDRLGHRLAHRSISLQRSKPELRHSEALYMHIVPAVVPRDIEAEFVARGQNSGCGHVAALRPSALIQSSAHQTVHESPVPAHTVPAGHEYRIGHAL